MIALVRASAYSGRNCDPMKIRGLDPVKDAEEDEQRLLEMWLADTYRLEVIETIKQNELLMITMGEIHKLKNIRF